MTRLWILLLGLFLALMMVLAPAAATDRKPPRIVAAAVLDVDGDARADRVRLTYSERVRHAADRDGRYPFAVSGYRIRSVGKASGRALVVTLVERADPDTHARPPIRYRRTRNQPVFDRAGNQALTQPFARTTPHGHAPQTPPAPPASPSPADADGDGTPDADDCAPRDAAIHPGAPDVPDLAFLDSNCDRIDGTEQDAVFVSPNGNDDNPGTKAKPKREVAQAVAAAAAGGKRYVLVAFGTYGRVYLSSRISIYGGYDPSSWQRRDRYPDGLPLIAGQPDGVAVDGVKDVVLQHLSIRGSIRVGVVPDGSAYGIRAFRGAGVTLQRVVATAGNGAAGRAGGDGSRAARGRDGDPGQPGSCDDGPDGFAGPAGGAGGASPTGRSGGQGGSGGFATLTVVAQGNPGQGGKTGSGGGRGGSNGNPGEPGGRGNSGENGGAGKAGVGAQGSASGAGVTWAGRKGSAGSVGGPGNGGGGGGGGGGQDGVFADNGAGNGGGGGGGGGVGGTGGEGGAAGGGSFGVYLHDSRLVVEHSTIRAGNGGAGGRGGNGGLGGAGGAGGKGGRACTSEVGAGGDGGFGGSGGRGGGGGGGAGGPSIGILKTGSSTVTLKGTTKITNAIAGPGGAGGNSGPGGTGSAGFPGIAIPIQPVQP